MTLRKKIERKVEKERKEAGFEGKVTIQEKPIPVDPHTGKPIKSSFSGCVAPKTLDVDIAYSPDYEKEKPGKTEKVVTFIGRHEFGHIHDDRTGEGCPGTLDKHLEFVKIFKGILAPKGFNSSDVQYAVNAFEDVIDNAQLTKAFDIGGAVRFYEDVGDKSGYSQFYEAFVKLQSTFFPNRYKKLITPFYKNTDKVKKCLDKFKQRTGINSMRTTIDDKLQSKYNQKNGIQQQSYKNTSGIVDYLTDENNWDNLAKVFAEEFSELMEPGYALPIPGLSGEGTTGYDDGSDEQDSGSSQSDGSDKDDKEESDKDDKDGEGKGPGEDSDDNEDDKDGDGSSTGDDGEESDSGNDFDWDALKGGHIFDQMMQDSANRKDKAYEDFQNGKSLPELIDYYEALNAVYERKARRLNIKAESIIRNARMPAAWFGMERFDPKRHRARHLKVGFEKGKATLMRRKYHQDITFQYKDPGKGFPEARFILIDSSESMLHSPNGGGIGDTNYIPWGTNSKYHYALLAWYGFIEFLRQNRILKRTKISLGNFSNVTYLAKGLDEAKKQALKPQWGGTYLNLDTIEHMFEDKGLLVFTISDGDISNWSSIKDKYIESVTKHLYFHIQISSYDNAMTRDLKAHGIPVFPVTGDQDLFNKVIEVSSALYKKNGRGQDIQVR